MKATGVVRKLDDLGRLVIPKEIRKQYGLKEGDSIEFFAENENIVIKKFDLLSKHMKQVKVMCETLHKMYDNSVLFIHDDKDCIFDRKPKDIFIRSIRKVRKALEFKNEAIFEDETITYDGRVYPVIANGDIIGSFVILFDKHTLSKSDLLLVEGFVEILARQYQ